MATRKKSNIDIHVGEEVAAAAAEPGAAGQPVSQAANEIPDLTVRIFPITKEARDKLHGQILHSYE